MKLIEQILAELRPNAWRLIPQWFPHGKYSGKCEYLILNPMRDDKVLGSFSINLERGFGYDFAEHLSYSLIDLYALAHGISVVEAIRALRFQRRFAIAGIPRSMEKMCKKREPDMSPKHANIAPIPLREASIFHRSLGHPQKVYCYRDSVNNIIGYTCLFLINSENGRSKVVLPLTYGPRKNGGDWSWSEAGWNGLKPIYHRESLHSCHHRPVLITEGEKTCEASARLFPHLCCISWRGGAGTVQRVDWSPLLLRDVYIWPDHDEPGARAASQIQSQLPHAKIVTPPAWKPVGWDIADAEDEGISREKLLKYMKENLKVGGASLSLHSSPLSTSPCRETPS